MKIILKNGIATFAELGYLPLKDFKVDLDLGALDMPGVTIMAKINELPSRVIKDSIMIPVTQITNHETLKVDITLHDSVSGISLAFKMDPVQLRTAVLLGKDVYEQYPATLKTILADHIEMRTTMELMANSIIELEKRGGIGL